MTNDNRTTAVEVLTELLAATEPATLGKSLYELLRAHTVPAALEQLRQICAIEAHAEWQSDPALFAEGQVAEDAGEGWWLCPHCSDALEAQLGVQSCPGCRRELLWTGVRVTWPKADHVSVFLVPWQCQRLAVVATIAGERYTGLPRRGTLAWSRGQKSSMHSCRLDAWMRALHQHICGDVAADFAAEDAAYLFDVFELTEEAGYFDSRALVEYFQEATAPELSAMAQVFSRSFSFLPGASWVPKWQSEARREGSPLAMLEPLLKRLQQLSPVAYERACAHLIGYVLADADVFVHDARAMSRNLGATLLEDLSRAKPEHLSQADVEALITGLARAAHSANGVEYGTDVLGALLHITQWSLSEVQHARVIEAILVYASPEEHEAPDPLAVYTSSGVIPESIMRDYAQRIAQLPEFSNHRGLRALGERMRQHVGR